MSSRRPITDKLRCEFVRARFEPLNSTGQLTPLAELAGRFVREQAVISKAMRKAFKDRLIGVDVRERRADRSERVPALERAMLSSFGALLDAIVIDTEQDRHSKPTIPEPSGVSDRLTRLSDGPWRRRSPRDLWFTMEIRSSAVRAEGSFIRCKLLPISAP